MSLFGDVDMSKVMMGERAFQVPLNMIVQPMGDDDTVIGVFQTSQGRPLLHGSKRTHVLVLGDMIFRPRLVMASDAFRGGGFSHLATCGFTEMEKWMEGDTILAPFAGTPLQDFEENTRRRR